VRRVLDAGSGPGKFCIAGAASAPTLNFVGVEHRLHLVDEARTVAQRLRVANAVFVGGDATAWAPGLYDAVFFFNPLGENVYEEREEQFDQTVELSTTRFFEDVTRTELRLESARKHFVVVTYCGFGGRIPGNYEIVHTEGIGIDWLRVWRKMDDGSGRGLWYREEGERLWTVDAGRRRGLVISRR
jgi:hypothetical protein